MKPTDEQVAKVSAALKRSIFNKIPQLNGQQAIYLPVVYFKKLTDEEFVVLWKLPDLKIQVSEQAAKYIENRRKLLGLRRGEGSEVLPLKRP